MLKSLTDFDQFCEIISAQGTVQKPADMTEMKGFANDEVFMNKLNSLQSDAKAEEGWTEMLNEGNFIMVTKDVRPDETLMRGTFEIDLPPKQCLLMFTYVGDERKEWQAEVKSSEVIKELAPGD